MTLPPVAPNIVELHLSKTNDAGCGDETVELLALPELVFEGVSGVVKLNIGTKQRITKKLLIKIFSKYSCDKNKEKKKLFSFQKLTIR